MGGLLEDFTYALRQVRKNPRVLALIVIILGIGIGANATIFSLIEAAARLPIRDQNTIVLLWSVNPSRNLDRTFISAGDFSDMKKRLPALQDLAAFSDDSVDVQGPAQPIRLPVQRVTANFFSVLGVGPAIGRAFSSEDAGSAEPAAILAHSTWQTHFGGDPAILNQSVEINGLRHKIIAVMKPDFQYLSEGTAMWVAMRDPSPTDDRTARDLLVVGRLRDLGDAPQVQAQAASLAQQLSAEYPNTDAGWNFTVTGPIPVRSGEAFVLGLIVFLPFLVLGIACANIANILLARGVGRQREIAVRLALGASRLRIIRLLLVESMLYSLAGGAIGVLVGVWGADSMRGFSFLWANARVDFAVLAASLATSVFCGVLFGLTPALYMTRASAGETLKRTSRAVTIDLKGDRLRSALMVGEIGAATLLLLLAGLVLRSVMELRAIDTGFRVAGVQTFRAALMDYRYATLPSAVQGHLAIADELRKLPGVVAAGAGTRVPTQGGRNNPTQQIEIDGRTYPGKDRDWAQDLTITPGYFEALGVPLLRGRLFNSADSASAAPVAIIGMTMARRYWQVRDPVGQRFRLTERGPDSPWITVAGVVGDVRNDDAGAPPLPTVYLPLTQHPVRALTYVFQTSGYSSIAATTIQAAVARVDLGLPIYDVRTMGQLLNDDLSGAYFTAGFIAVLGIVALSLAAIGIFGVLSYVTTERRPEIAIRMALGAMPNQIVRTFVWRALRLASVGIGVGGVLATLLFRFIRSELTDISVLDPFALGVTISVLVLVAAAACYLPARRATKLDPMNVLRWE